MGRLLTCLACALVIALPARAGAEEPSAAQKIAITAKPSVVRVWGAYLGTFDVAGSEMQEAIGGTGTGWFMTADGYIATNAHVVADIQAGDAVAKDALKNKLLKDLDAKYHAQLAKMSDSALHQLADSIHLVGQVKALHFVVLPNGDKLDYDVKQFGAPGTGNDCAIIKVKIENAPTLPIGDSTKSQVEDHVVVIGYPGVADMQDLLDEKSQLEASVTDGAISSLKRATTGEQILQISAPITHGNSGGPAIDQHGNVVGLATFGNESEVQGFNFLVASATLMELVKKANITPQPSDTNKAWSSGLEHYWHDEYSAAIKDFEQVQMLFPQHSEAATFIRNANQAKKDGKEKKDEGGSGAVIGLVIGGVVLAILAVVMIRRGRRAAPRPNMPMQPNMMPPQPYPQQPQQMPPPQQQMYGRAPQPGPPQQVAKTMAVGMGPNGSGGIAPTAFGSLAVGSLICTRGSLTGQRFSLNPTGVIVGRQPGIAHVLVNDHRASGKHVWIGIENGKLVAIDQGTTNGTYINDMSRGRITRAELRDGDSVIVGEPDCCTLQVKVGG
ncbi:MAG TPA: trypsin-like peptidase domain-containing protein [Kofleriaceae bacterium]|jgi:S1-C subfamily serine protease